MSKEKEPHRRVVRQGKFHAHRKFLFTYSVQLGTDNEQQCIDLSNSRGGFGCTPAACRNVEVDHTDQ